MANLVITIGRENGSGGRQLGSELAAALGVKCYDSELINETAKASGFAKSFVETHEEHRPGSFLYSLVTGGGVVADEQPFPVQIFQAQSEVIRTIAARESCVIVGRCADYVLRDDPNVALVNLFVHAPLAARIRRPRKRKSASARWIRSARRTITSSPPSAGAMRRPMTCASIPTGWRSATLPSSCSAIWSCAVCAESAGS